MTGLLYAGAGVGLGVAVLLWALVPARPSLAVAIATLRQPPPARPVGRARLLHSLAAPLVQLGLPRERARKDLAILERDPTAFLAGQVGLAGLGLLAPTATVGALNALGATITYTVPLWLGLLLGAGAFAVSELSIREEAEARRLLMRHTLGALLDVVPPALAAGAGIEQALTDASSIAEGWAARRIRDALTTARVERRPLWEPLRELGETTGVIQLEQLAGTLQLAAGEGTRIREALLQRGEALTERLTAEMEAHAESATERMSIPLMALTFVFLLFLIYPAIAAIGVGT
ncbi:type II secretion system F family protein [Dactylosporangium vinaceum]|uniref:Type II secretion system F family protein n=1 Tax=Dactylosporangium vinaceum TaxID=53362 RepID=A0ABV5M2F5_9ACTN|nr:type II secretion system F family protein [Dactylosporangium vinaceum]UAB96262.1 type II secretion system F family protein [Dactylosporangium vinaceum]